MKNDEREREGQLRPAKEAGETRRKVLRTGMAAIPTIFTLTAVPAWANTDYTRVAYRYGTHAGKCRNPRYDPRANPNSRRGREFVRCKSSHGDDDDRGGRDDDDDRDRRSDDSYEF